jgi:hypothetical protein
MTQHRTQDIGVYTKTSMLLIYEGILTVTLEGWQIVR